jgi:predicted acylesterase/phospholipase RssA
MEGQKKKLPIKTKKRAHLPKMPFNNIAISLSGGGFRATSIHLGVLSYLSSLKLYDISFLERIRVISTVSAGTLAGVKYASTLKKGGSFEEFYRTLLDFMTKVDLVEEALEYLSKDSNWNATRKRSLINAFSSVYHKKFESEHFGLLCNKSPEIHLKEMSFGATEFDFALPFHFQKTERVHPKVGNNTHEYIGNKKMHIPIEIAKEIRLADIIAASSCFPFGFEPINFPDDFIYDGAVKLKDRSLFPKYTSDGDIIEYPVGLMDGGIDDNQGVDSIVNAEERMKHYSEELKEFRSHDKKAIDLYILSDGTNPTMQSYTPLEHDRLPYIGKWSFKLLRNLGIFISMLGMISIIYAGCLENRALIIFMSIIGTIGLLAAFVFFVFSKGLVGLSKRVGIPPFFSKRLFHVDKLKFGTLNNLLVNRRNSVLKMITKVFIKQMRWFSIERVYGDYGWRPRFIINVVYELTRKEVESRKAKYPYLSPHLLKPSEDVIKVAERSLKMNTTLWFTPEQLKGNRNMPNSIIACGQFTICFNLIEYFEKFLFNPKYSRDYNKYSPETKEELVRLYNHLLGDWEKFNKDPFWMLDELHKKIGYVEIP